MPAPVASDDLAAPEQALFRVVAVVEVEPGGEVDVLAEVEPLVVR